MPIGSQCNNAIKLIHVTLKVPVDQAFPGVGKQPSWYAIHRSPPEKNKKSIQTAYTFCQTMKLWRDMWQVYVMKLVLNRSSTWSRCRRCGSFYSPGWACDLMSFKSQQPNSHIMLLHQASHLNHINACCKVRIQLAFCCQVHHLFNGVQKKQYIIASQTSGTSRKLSSSVLEFKLASSPLRLIQVCRENSAAQSHRTVQMSGASQGTSRLATPSDRPQCALTSSRAISVCLGLFTSCSGMCCYKFQSQNLRTTHICVFGSCCFIFFSGNTFCSGKVIAMFWWGQTFRFLLMLLCNMPILFASALQSMKPIWTSSQTEGSKLNWVVLPEQCIKQTGQNGTCFSRPCQGSLSSLQMFKCSWQALTMEEHAASMEGTSADPITNFRMHFSPQDKASKRLLLSSWSLGRAKLRCQNQINKSSLTFKQAAVNASAKVRECPLVTEWAWQSADLCYTLLLFYSSFMGHGQLWAWFLGLCATVCGS